MILTRQVEYEFEHLCMDSHGRSPCFFNTIYKNRHNYFDTKYKTNQKCKFCVFILLTMSCPFPTFPE